MASVLTCIYVHILGWGEGGGGGGEWFESFDSKSRMRMLS